MKITAPCSSLYKNINEQKFWLESKIISLKTGKENEHKKGGRKGKVGRGGRLYIVRNRGVGGIILLKVSTEIVSIYCLDFAIIIVRVIQHRLRSSADIESISTPRTQAQTKCVRKETELSQSTTSKERRLRRVQLGHYIHTYIHTYRHT